MNKRINPNLIRLAQLTHNPDITLPNLESKITPEFRIEPVEFDVKDPKEYAQLDTNGLYGERAVISKFELPGYNNMNYEDTHTKLLGNKLYVPTPRIFMHFFNKIVDAYKNKTPVLNAENSRLKEEEIKEIYLHLTTNHKAMYDPKKPGAWTWLNGKFLNKKKKWYLETINGLNNGKLVTIIEDLNPGLMNNCYIDFTNLNNQGLANPNAKHNTQEYRQGENIRYWKPEDGAVAWFDALSVGADFICNGDPQGSYSGLGVFGCAEGA